MLFLHPKTKWKQHHDGKSDTVVRTKHKFAVYFQQSPDSRMEVKTDNVEREGMTIGDVDGDGDYDVVMNGFWLENPRRPDRDIWKRHDIDPTWYKDITGGWQDHSVMADIKDMNNDGKADVILSHSEKTGFNIAWYETANSKGGPDVWTQHEVGIIDYCHTLRGDDIDLDGDIDIVAAILIRKKIPEICMFVNKGNSGVYLQNRYEIQILDGDSGKHGMAAVINEAAGPYHAYNGMGKWNAYDIKFRAAQFKNGKLTEKAIVTIFFNGIRAHTNNKIQKVWGGKNSGIYGESQDGTGITDVPGGLKLQCEGYEVLYRNAWIKELDIKEQNTDWDS